LKFGGDQSHRNNEIIEVAKFIGVKSYKAKGKRLSNYEVAVVKELEPVMTKAEQEEEKIKEETPDIKNIEDKNLNGQQMTLEW